MSLQPGATQFIPAVKYVRMSTEHQQYSTENQSDAIDKYAAAHGMKIVKSYVDHGKSGLTLAGRPSLRELLHDVERGSANFRVILVYDVSRWGRFQDADESAYYEYICKRANVTVRGLRGIDMISAATFIASTGDLSRFEFPRLLMGYLGLVPSEHSSGGTIRRGGITKTGNREARRMLIEAAWSYQYPARIAKDKAEILIRLPKKIRDIAWKAQTRLCIRYRSMIARGKKPTVVVAAIARELAGFIWAIGQEVRISMTSCQLVEATAS